MTLLELLVVVGLVSVIAGVLLETLVSVDKGVRQGQDQLAMTWAAEQTAAGVTSLLRHAVAVSALDAEAPTGTYEFTPTKCVVLVVGDDGRELERATVEQSDPAKDKGACVRVESVPIGRAQDAGSKLVLGTGGAPERFSTTLTFKYATKIRAVGYVPDFKIQLAPGEYPQLVRIRIQVDDLKKIEKSCVIWTAVRLM